MTRRTILLVFLLGWPLSCTTTATVPKGAKTPARTHEPLANGLYAVLSVVDSRSPPTASRDGARVLKYRDQFSPADQRDPDQFVTVATSPFVPLALAVPPEARSQPDGRTYLMVTLDRRNAELLKSFTKEHLGGRVAVVLDNEVLTMHKVRSVIEGGKMMITRCTDNACELIRSKLAK